MNINTVMGNNRPQNSFPDSSSSNLRKVAKIAKIAAIVSGIFIALGALFAFLTLYTPLGYPITMAFIILIA